MDKDAHASSRSISRRQMLKRGAIAGSAAIWVPPIIQSVRLPAQAQVGSPPPCITDGTMTGSGSAYLVGTSGKRVDFNLHVLDCPPQTSPPELTASWPKPGTPTHSFTLISFTSRTCEDTGIPNSPNANFDTIEGDGTGTLTINGVSETATVHFKFVDGGEGSGTTDYVTLQITGTNSGLVLNIVDKPVVTGNVQAHDGIFAAGKICTGVRP
jgi:hypothetical protein